MERRACRVRSLSCRSNAPCGPEAEPFLPFQLREIVRGACRDVALRIGNELEHVPVDRGLELAEALWVLLEHADQHRSSEPVLVWVGLDDHGLRLTLVDVTCTMQCMTRSVHLDRACGLGADHEERRCDVRSGRKGGVRLDWSAALDSGRTAGGRQPVGWGRG